MADAAGPEAAPASTEVVENVPSGTAGSESGEVESPSKMAVNWADYAESDEDESDDDSEDNMDAPSGPTEEAWDG